MTELLTAVALYHSKSVTYVASAEINIYLPFLLKNSTLNILVYFYYSKTGTTSSPVIFNEEDLKNFPIVDK